MLTGTHEQNLLARTVPSETDILVDRILSQVSHTLYSTWRRWKPATLEPRARRRRWPVAQYVDGILCTLDDRGPSSTPDFKLVRDGETVGWLEVTTGTDPTSTKQWKALEKQSSSFTTDRLRYDWLLLLEPAANVKRIKAESRLLDALVLRELVLTRYPTETIDAGLYEIHHPESDAILDDYGVQHAGWTGLAEGDAVVRLNPGARGAVIDMNLINRLAEERSAAKRHQLDRRPGERHILVRVDPWEMTGAGHAMWIGYENHPLPRPPDLPDWVTHMWMLAETGPPRLWHSAREADEWTVYDVDPAVFQVG